MGGLVTPNGLESTWREIWGARIPLNREIGSLASSYLTYIQDRREDLSRLLRDRGVLPRLNVTAIPDYVAWATLGVHLVEGYRWLAYLRPDAREILHATTMPLPTTHDWGRDALRALHLALRAAIPEAERRPSPPRFVQALSGLAAELAGPPTVPLGDVYVLGVMTAREPGDPPPPCTASAATIVTRGADGFYDRLLRDAARTGRAPDVAESLKRWSETERGRRAGLTRGAGR